MTERGTKRVTASAEWSLFWRREMSGTTSTMHTRAADGAQPWLHAIFTYSESESDVRKSDMRFTPTCVDMSRKIATCEGEEGRGLGRPALGHSDDTDLSQCGTSARPGRARGGGMGVTTTS